MQGKIIAIAGCMFSGKSNIAKKLIDKLIEKGHRVRYFKSSLDTRGGHSIIIRGHEKIKAQVIKNNEVNEIVFQSSGCGCVWIDDAHFFGPDLIYVINILVNTGKTVVITGLDTDFRGEPFSPMPEILAIADKRIFPKQAKCKVCGAVANRTQKLTPDGKPAPYDSNVIDPGGEKSGDKYESRCREHHKVPGIKRP